MQGARALSERLLGQGVWDEAARLELESLGFEKDPEIFFASLLRLAAREEKADHEGTAAILYSSFPQSGLSADILDRARSRHQALLGHGPAGARVEVLARRFFREALDPAGLLAMAGGQAVFSVARGAILARLFTASESAFTRGVLSRGLATSGAFALEAPAFVAFGRGARLAMGQSISAAPLDAELASSFLSLGILKISGIAAGSWASRLSPAMAASGLFRDAFMVGGLMIFHGLESRLGLRETQQPAESLLDSLITLLQFKAGGRIAQSLLGSNFERWNHALERRFAAPPSPDPSMAFSPSLAIEGTTPKIPAIFHMESFDEGGSRGRAAPPPSPRAEKTRDSMLDRISSLRIPRDADQLALEIHDPALSSQSARSRLLEIELRMDEVFRHHPWLQEAKVRLGDGTRLVYYRSAKGYLKQLESQDSSQYSALRQQRPVGRSHPVALWGEWAPLAGEEPLPALLRRRRLECKVSPQDAAVRVAQLTGSPKLPETILEYETKPGHKIAFPTLKALSEVYRLDIRDLIAASNRDRFPRIPREAWTVDAYPIYLESEADLARIERFRSEDPQRRSLGWLVFAVSKNPFAYVNTSAFQEATGQGSNLLSRMIGNRDYPSLETLESLHRELGISREDLLDAANRTFHPDLDLKRFFGGKSVYIHPSSDDRAKVLAYRQAPGSLGQELFAYRSSLPDHPGPQSMSRRSGLPDHRWDEMERNGVRPDASNWREWAEILKTANLPLNPIHRWQKPAKYSQLSAGELLQEGLGRESILAFVQRTGFNHSTIDKILATRGAPQRYTKSETIRDLQEHLPKLHGDLLFRELRPEILEFFPEAAGAEPALRLSAEDIAFAMDFRPSRDIFAHRMDRQQELSALGELVGVRYNTIRLYETCRICIEDHETIRNLGRAMDIDPRRLYLHYNPQILRLFPIVDPESGGSRRIDPAEYYQLTLAHPHRSGDNQRRKLKNLAHAIGIEDAASFGRKLGLEPSLAKKLWDDSWQAMSVEQIGLLQEKIPGFSYRANYEHFYGAALEYFLGRDSTGSIDYSPPRRTWTEETLGVAIREAAMMRYRSLKVAAQETGLNFIAKPGNLPRSLKARGWSDTTIAQASRGLSLDRRSLFWYFRGEELRPILQEMEGTELKSSSSETSR